MLLLGQLIQHRHTREFYIYLGFNEKTNKVFIIDEKMNIVEIASYNAFVINYTHVEKNSVIVRGPFYIHKAHGLLDKILQPQTKLKVRKYLLDQKYKSNASFQRC